MPDALFSDLPIAWLAAIVLGVYAASIVQSALGVGFGLVAAPILMLIKPEAVPGVIILLGGSTAFLSALRGMKDVRGHELAIATAGRLIGTAAAGVALLLIPSREVFALVFAIAILAAVSISLFGPPIRLTARSLVVAGAMSGLLGTVTSVGAPPMGLVYQGEAAASARATLNAFFAIGVLPSFAVLAYTGYLTSAHVWQAALLLPVILAGVLTAKSLFATVDRRYRIFILGFCVLAAVAVAIRAVVRLLSVS